MACEPLLSSTASPVASSSGLVAVDLDHRAGVEFLLSAGLAAAGIGTIVLLAPLGLEAVAWGLLGVLALLARALITLSPIAIEAVVGGLTALQWAIAIGWVGFMAYSEGYRGFQKRFAPMVGARLLVIRDRPTLLRTVLAPMFCMGLIDATRRRLLVSWGVLVGVVLLIIAVRFAPQPWRGIIDLGVLVGLTWGSLAVIGHAIAALRTGIPRVSAKLPGSSEPPGDVADEPRVAADPGA